MLAYTLLYQWDLEGSEKAFDRSIALNPSDANDALLARGAPGGSRTLRGEPRGSVPGRQLDPISPIITAGLSWMNHFARKHEQAAAMAVATLGIEPDFVIAHARRGMAFKHLGDYAGR